ncbi:MAG: hypothetical protein JST39_06760, partial [Bacteroidetes bacterium]|nr:hypothetical protein [Bacteroidota bacterium]
QPVTVASIDGSYNYPLTTDSKGSFLLPGLPPADNIRLTSQKLLNDSAQYQVLVAADSTTTVEKAGNMRLLARPDTLHYKGVLIRVADTSNGPIRGAQVWAYTSGELAKKDTGYIGLGSLFQLTSNRYGLCLAMQLPAGNLYLRARFSADSGRVVLKGGVDTVAVTGYVSRTIKIK